VHTDDFRNRFNGFLMNHLGIDGINSNVETVEWSKLFLRAPAEAWGE